MRDWRRKMVRLVSPANIPYGFVTLYNEQVFLRPCLHPRLPRNPSMTVCWYQATFTRGSVRTVGD